MYFNCVLTIMCYVTALLSSYRLVMSRREITVLPPRLIELLRGAIYVFSLPNMYPFSFSFLLT